ncbi:FAD-binding oxidoreductase [Leifsonia poae]|uniref:D-amino-acid oxidase n=1 Tax=Leifsonia poae TaxID=110933 RepID=A0A9W6M058_9MICO|nr:D-amino-acid oxidase [Leifsonia poae]
MAGTGERVVVVGAGITGSSIAYHLAERGADVVVLDQGLPASGATGSSFGWVGRPVSSRLPSAPLRYLAIDDWHRIAQALPDFPISWQGSLVWGHEDPDEMGLVNTVDDTSELEPSLRVAARDVQYREQDGSIEPVAATELLLEEAAKLGADVRLGQVVVGLIEDEGVVRGVKTASEVISASVVVLACGLGSVALCRGVGFDLPVDASPTVLVRLDAPAGLVQHVLMSPDVEVRQLPNGQLLAPVEYSGERSRGDLTETATEAERRINTMLDSNDEVRARSAEIGWRPMPADGEPIIGPVPGTPGLYVAVMHSAITLAASVGRLVTAELLDGLMARELEHSRPARFRTR